MELDRICKRYGSKEILRDFSCQIPEGAVCAITAPSGAGKTTLLRLILGLEKPDSGRISGVPARKSAVFQEDRLCPGLSLLANLRMALPGCSEESMREILAELDLAGCLDTEACQLSGGMARRAALARALLYDGGLLVLDEPFTGLDEANRLRAAACILRRRNGRTLLLVTHHEEDLELLQATMQIPL